MDEISLKITRRKIKLAVPGGWVEFTITPVLISETEGDHITGTPVEIAVTADIEGDAVFTDDPACIKPRSADD